MENTSELVLAWQQSQPDPRTLGTPSRRLDRISPGAEALPPHHRQPPVPPSCRQRVSERDG